MLQFAPGQLSAIALSDVFRFRRVNIAQCPQKSAIGGCTDSRSLGIVGLWSSSTDIYGSFHFQLIFVNGDHVHNIVLHSQSLAYDELSIALAHEYESLQASQPFLKAILT